MKKQSHLINLVTASLLAALCCVATFIKLAITPTGGYVNLGDVVIILAAFLLSPLYAALAAGIGSMLADILMGYAQYAPGTLVIKALMALFASLVLYAVKKISDKNTILSIAFIILAGVCAEAVMVGGYFVFEAYILGYGAAGALASVLPNVFQGIAGIVGGTLLCLIFKRIKIKK
ncbi:MAG: ECF transporter S component [Ruminococcaceae bacterium]|nr:ECF transporter S component [Oscillospiraceae bacterium]